MLLSLKALRLILVQFHFELANITWVQWPSLLPLVTTQGCWLFPYFAVGCGWPWRTTRRSWWPWGRSSSLKLQFFYQNKSGLDFDRLVVLQNLDSKAVFCLLLLDLAFLLLQLQQISTTHCYSDSQIIIKVIGRQNFRQ